jgi:hypothetical protein
MSVTMYNLEGKIKKYEKKQGYLFKLTSYNYGKSSWHDLALSGTCNKHKRFYTDQSSSEIGVTDIFIAALKRFIILIWLLTSPITVYL